MTSLRRPNGLPSRPSRYKSDDASAVPPHSDRWETNGHSRYEGNSRISNRRTPWPDRTDTAAPREFTRPRDERAPRSAPSSRSLSRPRPYREDEYESSRPRRVPMHERAESRTSESSDSANSSIVSSLWENKRGNTGGSSSGSSVEEKDGSDGKHAQETQENATSTAGSLLWSRVVAATGSLSINVAKAWAGDQVEEVETPTGQESRITLALKKYHLARVNSPSELPDWLFSDIERGIVRGRASSHSRTPPAESLKSFDIPPVRTRARHVHEHEPVPPLPAVQQRSRWDDDDAGSRAPTRAASRLKAMRETKRSGLVGR